MTNWRNMPGPGDPETWGPCNNHPNDPRTPDDTERVERITNEIIEKRFKDIAWFREALSEADDNQIEKIMQKIGSGGKLAETIRAIVSAYVEPNDWEVQDQIEMEEEPDDRV